MESISSESQIIENNIPYEANQPATMMRGWPMAPGMEPLGPMLIHPGMIIPDEIMRGGPNQPSREYGHPVRIIDFINKRKVLRGNKNRKALSILFAFRTSMLLFELISLIACSPSNF